MHVISYVQQHGFIQFIFYEMKSYTVIYILKKIFFFKKKLNDRDREGRHVLVGLGFHILSLSIPNPLLRLQCCASRIPTPIARTAGRHGEPHVAGVAAGLLRLHRPHAPPRRRRPLPLHQEVRRFAPLPAPLLVGPCPASILT